MFLTYLLSLLQKSTIKRNDGCSLRREAAKTLAKGILYGKVLVIDDRQDSEKQVHGTPI